ncbi:hypothetical protein BAE44_0007189, partial [Dichanthelium oligosanthes]
LEKQTFHATEGCGGGVTECAICLEEFEDGEEAGPSQHHEFLEEQEPAQLVDMDLDELLDELLDDFGPPVSDLDDEQMLDPPASFALMLLEILAPAPPGFSIGIIAPPLGEEEGYSNGGFGAVPASAAAVADLEKHKFHAGGRGGGATEVCGAAGCSICLEEFEDGEEVSVMPCSRGHEFHPNCITKWLGISNMCPLCRHELPPTPPAARLTDAGGSRPDAHSTRGSSNNADDSLSLAGFTVLYYNRMVQAAHQQARRNMAALTEESIVTPELGEAFRDGGGFRATPASAAAVARLEKRRYGGSSGGGSSTAGSTGVDAAAVTCAICIEDFEIGDDMSIMPCSHSRIAELSEALRRLNEIAEEAVQIIHEHDDGQRLAVAGGADSYDDSAGSFLQHRDPVPMASDDQNPADLCFDETEEDYATQLGYQDHDFDIRSGPVRRAIATGRLYVPSIQATSSVDSDQAYHDPALYNEEPEYPIQREHHLYNQAAVYDTFGQQPTAPARAAGHLQETWEAADSGDHGGHLLLSYPALYDDTVTRRLRVPPIVENAPLRISDGGGFGAVPASAAAIAALEKHEYDGSGADNMCVICMRDYKKGKRLYVMPCAQKHRFHRKCLKKWLSRSNLCPLCRHALPNEEQASAMDAQVGGLDPARHTGSLLLITLQRGDLSEADAAAEGHVPQSPAGDRLAGTNDISSNLVPAVDEGFVPPDFTEAEAYRNVGFGGTPASGAAIAKLKKQMYINMGPRDKKRRRGMGGETAVTEAPCAICFEDLEFGDVLSVMPCSHRFHAGCLAKWLALSRLCPCCRHALPGEGETTQTVAGHDATPP